MFYYHESAKEEVRGKLSYEEKLDQLIKNVEEEMSPDDLSRNYSEVVKMEQIRDLLWSLNEESLELVFYLIKETFKLNREQRDELLAMGREEFPNEYRR